MNVSCVYICIPVTQFVSKCWTMAMAWYLSWAFRIHIAMTPECTSVKRTIYMDRYVYMRGRPLTIDKYYHPHHHHHHRRHNIILYINIILFSIIYYLYFIDLCILSWHGLLIFAVLPCQQHDIAKYHYHCTTTHRMKCRCI